MSTLLPKRFGASADVELAELCEKFKRVSQQARWHDFLLKAIQGPAGGTGDSLDAFMLELERWSMELQRSSPKDWNQCSSVIVQCLTGDLQKERESEFNV